MKFIFYSMMLMSAPILIADADAISILGRDAGNEISRDAESDFIFAYDAFRAKDPVKLERFAQRLRSTPLKVNVDYYRLKLRLENADDKEVIEFLSRPNDSYLFDQLRVDWLKLLGKRHQWDLFDLEFPRVVNEDTEVTCYALQSHMRTDKRGALRQARLLWFSSKGMPESCTVLFEAGLISGIISDRDVDHRLRLALEANNLVLAQQLIGRVSGYRTLMSEALKTASANPDRYLKTLNQEDLSSGRNVIALYALQRVAQQSLDIAVNRWTKISDLFSKVDQQYFYGRLAYQAARNLDDRALGWFRAAAVTTLDENQAAWRVRASLRAGDWSGVLNTVNAMGEPQQHEPAWQYWKARALKVFGSTDESREIFARLSGNFDFYGQLANDELEGTQVMSEPTAVYKPDKKAIADMKVRPAVQRTLALYRMGLRSEALEEWRWLVRSMEDRELLAAAEVARRNEMYDRAIGAADKTVSQHDFSMRYLAPYRAELQEHIHEQGLDEAWVYGLMRQESRFTTSAKSEAGAAGLMQIMPSTARWVAKKLGLKSYRKALIHQLDTNLRIGTYYMKSVLSRSENNPVLASASYNAGPMRALQWRGDEPLEGAIYAETIPYPETRNYVKKVMSNTVYYADQFGDASRSLKQRLGTVPARYAKNDRSRPYVP